MPNGKLRGRAFKLGTSDKSFHFLKTHTSEKVRSTPGPSPAIGSALRFRLLAIKILSLRLRMETRYAYCQFDQEFQRLTVQ